MWGKLAGAIDSARRADTLLQAAARAGSFSGQMDLAVGAVYPARAALQLVRDAAKRRELKLSVREIDRIAEATLPYWKLVHALRIEAFHRSGLVVGENWLRGSITIPAGQTTTLSFGPIGGQMVAEIANADGSTPTAEVLLWFPPVVQNETGTPAFQLLGVLGTYQASLPAFFASVARHA